jgi:hypothetical protein
MFFCISLFAIPIFYGYNQGNAFSTQKSYPVSRWMLGNLGSTSVYCDQNE